MMLATTSTRWGIPMSLVKMAFLRARREDMQSRVSAPFSRLTMNSVMASPFQLPNTLEVVHSKQCLKKRRSKFRKSFSFWRYPLPRYLQKAYTSMVAPQLIDITDTSGPIASTIRSNSAIFWWGSIQRCHTNFPEDV